VCVSQVKAVLLNVIKTLSHIDARLGCSSGQIYGLEGGPWRVPRRKIGSVTVGGKAEYAVRPPEYVHLHCMSHSGRDQEIAHKQRQKSGDVSSCSVHKSRILHQNLGQAIRTGCGRRDGASFFCASSTSLKTIGLYPFEGLCVQAPFTGTSVCSDLIMIAN
jgi:hypothetical protein